ncbi:acyl-CoA dehydrogenase [Frankia sp. CNm7]|uniref:Acyl-CoA dehydrogenase n=1 Tax=Frankia nepalensis TaxID=1836974 RepID=A0A937RLN2_9ACTN|nr:acyl-CoA dehydrogenase [Frankia nepalensis]MBL7501755.1 acyl-CoA dehydrogenase [Frankia nepalensis]MBL7513548.1 acyl-CoA dehydrogenase [Frankia nepalensis]MBL7519189.1 acyl-CoA dehydrogenase [Frankia nepalensis]MBL7628181.1 acyl-CoA dehydrogenase [Frankia nepalensis]
MDFTLAEEEAAVDELARAVLTEASTQERLAALEEADEPYDRELWATLAATGLLGVVVPAELGGAGLADGGLLALGALLEHAGRTAARVPLLPTLAYGALPLARFGAGGTLAGAVSGDTVADGWLRRVAAGEAILTGAFAEPLTDPPAPTTTARPVPAPQEGDDGYRAGGAGWLIDGGKAFVPAGTIADAALVSAIVIESTGRRVGVGVFVVDTDAPGVTVTAQPTLTGVPVARLELSGVRVAPDALLGPADGSVLAWTLERATAASCAMMAGLADAAVRLSATYTTTRHQFGHPLADFQAVRQRVADAFVDSRAIKLTASEALWRLANGLPAEREVAVAKAIAAEAGTRVVRGATHVHGGTGVDRAYPLHRHYLAARQLELTLGSATPQLRALGRLLAAADA